MSTRAEDVHRSAPLAGTPAYPVKFFAVFGMFVAAVYAEVLFRWVTGPYFKASPVGTDPIPDWELWLIRFSEVFCRQTARQRLAQLPTRWSACLRSPRTQFAIE